MSAERKPALPPVRMVGAPWGVWDTVSRDIRTTGVALAATTLGRWESDRPVEPRVRTLLGRDLPRYTAMEEGIVRERFAASRVLLRCVVAAAIGVPPGGVDIGYHLSGRPYARGYDQVDISLSHTGDIILVGVTSRGRIGVDVEPAGRAKEVAELDRHICTPHELGAVNEGPAGERAARLLRTWMLKEAYSKALGQGLRFSFTEFGFAPAPPGRGARGVRAARTPLGGTVTAGPGPALLCGRDGAPVDAPTWRFHSLDLEGGMLAAVALQYLPIGSSDDIRGGTAVDRRTVRAIWGRTAAG
ncbi:4'-phosphopantetheinyl transferase superfamily protein [Streptomyces sp. YIM 98790]|uniref:4'-phosphopantetheinyl transferase family protein n=1 Tax=Streptomyces sp. YIM 98790 TaxID=2689077 RepID=UPI0014095E20|nr:4'-phosphopantetheinyl transferase superfamily protein [Streptomyces sp. YIM 98790]